MFQTFKRYKISKTYTLTIATEAIGPMLDDKIFLSKEPNLLFIILTAMLR